MRVHKWGWVALLLSCKSTPTPVPAAEPAATTVRVPDGAPRSKAAQGGFVVFTGSETYLVPLDPEADVQRYPGWFIGYAGGSADIHFEVALGEDRDAAQTVTMPYCVDALEEYSCGRETTTFVDATARLEDEDVAVTLMSSEDSGCDCISVEWLSDEGAERYYEALRVANNIEEEELAMAQFDDVEAYIQACYVQDLDLSPVAYLGGVAEFHETLSSVECGGSNSYALESKVHIFREGMKAATVKVSDAFTCYGELDASLGAPGDLGDTGCAFGEDECCPHAGEGTAAWIVSGMLVEYAGDSQPAGGSCGCVHSAPISAETCPSAYDPCGQREGFPALSGAAWWVSTDGSAGLNLTEAGDLQVFARGEDVPTRVEELSLELWSIVGVEVLPDMPSREPTLPASVVASVPRSTENPGRSWGNLCFKRFKEGKLDLAEGACVQGLLETHDDDKVRGALTYSLGRIEEARGHQARAKLLYARSLRLRPGHAAVQKRLESLK